MPATTPLHEMSNTAFAGFLRLLLTPLGEIPSPSRELQAYLRYLNQTAPSQPLEQPWGERTRLEVPEAVRDLPFSRDPASHTPSPIMARNRLAR